MGQKEVNPHGLPSVGNLSKIGILNGMLHE